MSNEHFREGFLVYEAGPVDEADIDLDLAKWDDGYLAFSTAETRLSGIRDRFKKEWLEGEIDPFEAFDGYLMEIDLWRKSGGVFEELVLEREDDGFKRQYWRLSTDPGNEKPNCYWQEAFTRARKPIGAERIFNEESDDLRTIEVVWPKHRLHFFITAGGAK
jgi:hypothetical protein